MIEGNEPLGVLVLVPLLLVDCVWPTTLGHMVEDFLVLGPALVALVLAIADDVAIAGDGVPGQ